MKATSTNTFRADEAGRRFLADASEIGIRVGSLPDYIPTDLGNGRDFEILAIDEDVLSYQQPGTGLSLNVLND